MSEEFVDMPMDFDADARFLSALQPAYRKFVGLDTAERLRVIKELDLKFPLCPAQLVRVKDYFDTAAGTRPTRDAAATE